MTEAVATPLADDLQFDRAEMKAPAPGLVCRVCKQPIFEAYYSLNSNTFCASCRAKVGDGRRPLTFKSLASASVYGFGAAILGAVVWGGIREATGYNIGFVAVVVGVLIGRAVRTHGAHLGGWAFQAVAIAMTYLCVGLSLVTEVWKAAGEMIVQRGGHVGSVVFWILFVFLVAIGPILASFGSILGFLINGFAFYEAWKLNKRQKIVFAGPLEIGSQAAPPALAVTEAETPAVG